MLADILPLAYTQVDWKILIQSSQKALGLSPTRGLDSAGIKIDDHQAYLATLGFDNKPLEQLRSGGWDGSFKHVHFSFVTVASLETIASLSGIISVLYRIIDFKTDDSYAIYTGDMEQWRNLIIKYAIVDATIELRGTACRIMNYLENLGFKDLWSEYTKQSLNDKTFILKRR